jgi:peptidyl-prolyl cis-trans isomerase A (cyclophilin A)
MSAVRRLPHLSWALTVALALSAAVARAQSAQNPPAQTPATGDVVGVVTDGGGAPLGGVAVSARSIRGGDPIAATSAADGAYRLTLPVGIYRVTFAKAGFAAIERSGIVAVSAAPFSLNVTLVPAGGGVSTAPGTSPEALRQGEVLVRITTPLGTIDIAVDTARAPITAGNFLKYVDAGLYDGGRFYRVTRTDNYEAAPPNRPMMHLIQGGIDPAKNSQRLPPVPLERTSVTGLRHVAGTVSMARGTADSATSEFFILLDDQPSLDFGGKRFDDEQGAAAFGRVIAGLDVVRTINQQNPLQERNRQQLQTPVPITSMHRVRAGLAATSRVSSPVFLRPARAASGRRR